MMAFANLDRSLYGELFDYHFSYAVQKPLLLMLLEGFHLSIVSFCLFV